MAKKMRRHRGRPHAKLYSSSWYRKQGVKQAREHLRKHPDRLTLDAAAEIVCMFAGVEVEGGKVETDEKIDLGAERRKVAKRKNEILQDLKRGNKRKKQAR